MAALTEAGHEGKTYEITGPAAISYGECAAALGEVLGRTIRYGTVAPEAGRGALIDAGLPPLDAIEAATATGPETLGGQAPLSGLLSEGYDADVIALDFNPLEDWTPWGDPARVTHIWQAGEPVKD